MTLKRKNARSASHGKMLRGHENWHKLKRLYYWQFNDEGVTALASGVIERAVIDLKTTEVIKLKHKKAIGVESATVEQLKWNTSSRKFFQSSAYDFFAQIAGLDVSGESVLNTVLNEANRIVDNTKGLTPTGKKP